MIVVFAVIVIGAVVAVAVLASRHRPDGSIESGILSFRREMRALAPPHADPTVIPPYRASESGDDDPAGEFGFTGDGTGPTFVEPPVDDPAPGGTSGSGE